MWRFPKCMDGLSFWRSHGHCDNGVSTASLTENSSWVPGRYWEKIQFAHKPLVASVCACARGKYISTIHYLTKILLCWFHEIMATLPNIEGILLFYHTKYCAFFIPYVGLFCAHHSSINHNKCKGMFHFMK